MTRFILKFLLISKMPKAIFKEVQINSKGGAGRPLGQDGLCTEIWLTGINALRRQRQDQMQYLFTESGKIIKIQGRTAPEARRAPRPMMADRNIKIVFISMNFVTRVFTRSSITNLEKQESRFGTVKIPPKGPKDLAHQSILRLVGG